MALDSGLCENCQCVPRCAAQPWQQGRGHQMEEVTQRLLCRRRVMREPPAWQPGVRAKRTHCYSAPIKECLINKNVIVNVTASCVRYFEVLLRQTALISQIPRTATDFSDDKY